MNAVGMLWRSRLRRHWRSWALLALLLALGAGTGLASLAGARRTASSYDRIAAAVDQPDIATSHGLKAEEAEEIIGGFEGVASHSTEVGFVGYVEGLDPTLFKYFIGSWDKPLPHAAPLVRDGRLPDPDRADEVIAVGRGVAKGGIEPGDELTMQFFYSDFSGTAARTVTVTGTTTRSADVAADASEDRSAIYFTPAFVDANAAELQAWSASSFVADPGADQVVASQLREAGWSLDTTRAAVQARVQDAIRPLTTVLALLGALVLVATLAVVGQALARQAEAGRRESEAGRAMGLATAQVRSLDLSTVLSVVIPGALLTIAVAVALSPLFPVGTVRAQEPDRGVDADLTVLLLGPVSVVLLLLLASRIGARRSDRAQPAARLIPASLPAGRQSMGAGLRLASGGTLVQRRRFWATVAFSTAALALVVAGIAFVAALDRLSSEPVRYGAGWDLTTRNAFGEVPADDVRELLADDPDIEGLTGAGLTSVLLDGEVTVATMPILPITADLWPTVVAGTVPRGDDEVLVGADVLDRLDAEIGDRVALHSVYSPPDIEPRQVTIVGTAVFPSVELPGFDPTRLDDGLAMTWDGYQSLGGPTFGGDVHPDMIFFDLADGVDPQTVIDRYPEGMPEISGFAPTEWLPSLAPAEVLETDRAAALIWGVVVLLALTVLATTGHAQLATVRQRRRDYAVLKALGFTRRQVLSTVTWQSTATVVLALVLAIPVGTALGWWSWRTFANLLGVIDTTVVPVVSLLAVAFAAIVMSSLVSLVPGLIAARTPAAVLLHQE